MDNDDDAHWRNLEVRLRPSASVSGGEPTCLLMGFYLDETSESLINGPGGMGTTEFDNVIAQPFIDNLLLHSKHRARSRAFRCAYLANVAADDGSDDGVLHAALCAWA